MAKSTLPTNFKDDILNSSMGGKRRYKLINNSDGTVSLEDASAYDQVGSEYGASQVNAANAAVNASADAGKIVDDIDNIGAITQKGYIAGALALKQVNDSLNGLKFGKDGDGNYGYYGADGSLIPFNRKQQTKALQSSLEELTSNTGVHAVASATSALTEYAAYRAFIWDNNMYWSSAVLSKTDGAAVTYLDAEPFECRAIYLSISSPYYNFNYIAPLEHTGIVEYTVDGEHWIEVSRKVYTTSDYTLAHIFEVSAPKIRGLRYRALTPNSGSRDGSYVMCNSLIALA